MKIHIFNLKRYVLLCEVSGNFIPYLGPNIVMKYQSILKVFICWSLRCSWSIDCRRCSNYIFTINLTPGFNIMGKDNCKTRPEIFMFGDCVRLILENWRYIKYVSTHTMAGIILGMGLTNERCLCSVTSCLIGWAHTRNAPCMWI